MPADLPLDRLAQYPQLSFAVAVITVIGFAFAVYRGLRDRRTPVVQEPLEQRLFFDGPVNVALTTLRESLAALERIVENTKDVGEEQRKQTALLREIKDGQKVLHKIKDGIDDLMPQRKRR